MCFHVINRTLLVAEEDIKCWKEVYPWGIAGNGKAIYKSYYKGFLYIEGQRDSEVELEIYESDDGENIDLQVHKGYHSFSRKEALNIDWNSICVECIIPKGSKYYHNPVSDQYVSSNIIIKERI